MRKFKCEGISKSDIGLIEYVIKCHLFNDKGDRVTMTVEGITRLLEIHDVLVRSDPFMKRNLGEYSPDEWKKKVEDNIKVYRSNNKKI